MIVVTEQQARADAASLPVYDTARLQAEMQLFADWFLHRHLGLAIGGRTGAVLTRTFALLTDAALAQPTADRHRLLMQALRGVFRAAKPA